MTKDDQTEFKGIILLVDDNDINRYATKRILEQAGFRVIEARTGKEGLEAATPEIELVVLDVKLPDIDGFEVCRRLKANPVTRSIPVMHLTATYLSIESKIKGLDGGADGYLTQPVKPIELVATVNSLLRIRKAEERIRQELENWNTTFDSIGDAICILDTEGRIQRYNRAFAKFSGEPEEKIPGTHCWELFCQKYSWSVDCPLRKGETPITRETWELQARERYFFTTLDPIKDASGRVVRYVLIKRDVTEQKRIESALRESEDRFRRLADNAQDLIYRYEFIPKPRFAYVSPSATRITGYTPEEHYADPLLGFKIVHPEDRYLLEQTTKAEIDIRRPLVFRWIRKDGTLIWTEQRNIPIYDKKGNLVAIEGIARDITEQKEHEEKLRRALREKEFLVQELFHRTRNNMQVISSLLHLQADEYPTLAPVLKEMEIKIQIMALAHQQLIDSGNLSYLRLKEFLQEVTFLLEPVVLEENPSVILRYEGTDAPILLDTAVPLGISLNELIWNSLQHAFPLTMSGEINIRSSVGENKEIVIEVEDTGIGLPNGFTLEKNARKGLTLVASLIQSQLGGQLLYQSTERGTCWKIIIEKEVYSPRV
ncbi:MAG: PAS domain S-box protein [Spirochaetes bacterium]|nr:PAS domain S-box protein [Spirochaetota bacterium]